MRSLSVITMSLTGTHLPTAGRAEKFVDKKIQEAMDRAMREITYEIEQALYYGKQYKHHQLKNFLRKLGLKAEVGGQKLIMESLEGTLKQVTFDIADLKPWPKAKVEP